MGCFYCASKPLLRYGQAPLAMQASPSYGVKGACLHCKRGLLGEETRLCEAVFIAHFLRKAAYFAHCQEFTAARPKLAKNLPEDSLMDFSRVLSGRKMQISYHKRGQDSIGGCAKNEIHIPCTCNLKRPTRPRRGRSMECEKGQNKCHLFASIELMP